MGKKTLVALGSTMLLALVVLMPTLVAPTGAQGNNNPNKLWGAQTYLLNILGKKSNWNGDPSYESTDRRTMFVPENVGEFLALRGFTDCKIWVRQGANFNVTDPNMFDDGQTSFTIGPGKYEVYFVALGKPGRTAVIQGWIYNASSSEYLLNIGYVEVRHNKRPDWKSGHDMFYVDETEAAGILSSLGISWEQLQAALGYPPGATEVWVFDFVNWLAGLTGYEYLYLWKLVSGCKHIQVRFYKVG